MLYEDVRKVKRNHQDTVKHSSASNIRELSPIGLKGKGEKVGDYDCGQREGPRASFIRRAMKGTSRQRNKVT